MLRLPIWMIALSLTGCFFGGPKDEGEDEDDGNEWGNQPNENGWMDEPNGGDNQNERDDTGSSNSDSNDTGSSDGGSSDVGSSDGGSSDVGSSDVGASDVGSSDGGGGRPCDVNEVTPLHPETDGAEFYYRGSVEFMFDGIDEDATITVADATGASIAGTQAWMYNKLSFSPHAPLAPSSAYSTTITHCAGVSTIDFVTRDLGTPLDDPSGLVGNTYVVNFYDADFVKPAAVGGLLLGLFEQYILLGVTEVTDTEIRMMGAISKDKPSTDQDTCVPSITFPAGADFTTAPFFSIGPETIELSMAGRTAGINELMFAGDFSADGSYIGGAVMTGLLDGAELAGVLADEGLIAVDEPAAVCDLIATFGVSCEDCGDGRDECLSLHVNDITATETGRTLIEVETCDVDTCEEGCD